MWFRPFAEYVEDLLAFITAGGVQPRSSVARRES